MEKVVWHRQLYLVRCMHLCASWHGSASQVWCAAYLFHQNVSSKVAPVDNELIIREKVTFHCLV